MHDTKPHAEPQNIPAEFRLDSYVYELPPERIARRPAAVRDASKLLVLERGTGAHRAANFRELPEILAAKFPRGGLIIANNSKVFPARIFGRRHTGGRVELLVLTPLPLLEITAHADGSFSAEAEGLVRTAKRMKEGEAALFDMPDGTPEGTELTATLLARAEYGRCRLRLDWRGDVAQIFERIGHMPLPPYLEREDDANDRERYQTTYADARKAGSVAAPTAGLHMTPEVRKALRAKGFDWAEVTLYVGYGTFSPVREQDIRRHKMHAEYVELGEKTAQKIQKAKSEGLPVIALGTTSARSLEGAHAATGGVSRYAGETEIYITPGYEFRVVDALVTNFHLPESSLLIMVSALAGLEKIRAAYVAALDRDFRFFSYGDAMLII